VISLRSSRGFTLVEVLVTVSIMVILATAAVRFLPDQIQFFRHMRVRQQIAQDSRVCMDTIAQRLRNGRARSLILSSPSGPNSRIDFALERPLTSGATAYAVFLSSGSVFDQEFVPPGGAAGLHVLANNVTALSFTGDSTDPGIVGVSLRIDAPFDDSGDPSHVLTIIIPNLTVNMVTSS
jgi:prepilin-type N-terminal cleavage/methylation domain-containing protein